MILVNTKLKTKQQQKVMGYFCTYILLLKINLFFFFLGLHTITNTIVDMLWYTNYYWKYPTKINQ